MNSKKIQLLVLTLFFTLISLHAQAENCTIVRSDPNRVLEKCERLHVLHLKGTPVERARMHGELIGKELSGDVMEYFANKSFSSLKTDSTALRWFIEKALHQFTRSQYKAMPAELMDEVNALAKASNKDPLYIQRAMLLPDTANYLLSIFSTKIWQSIPFFGCTSVAKKSDDGTFAYGRNLDFASTTVWDAHPLLIVNIPPEGSKELRHLVFGADSLQFGGITGINEAGIGFTVQQIYAKDFTKGGMPMPFIGEMVLRSAKSLEEGVEILKKYRPSPIWTFILVDINQQKALSVESSMKHFSVREMSGNTFAQTNHGLTPDTQNEEYISMGTKFNSLYRYKKGMEILSSEKNASAALMAKALAHQEDASGDLSAYHDILKPHTIQSIIYEAKKKTAPKLFLTYEEAPVASGKYLEFGLNSLYQWPDKKTVSYKINDLVKTPAGKRERQKQTALAFAAYFDKGNYEETLKLMENQKSLDAALLRAILYYKLKEYEKALGITQEASANPTYLSEPIYIQQSIRWVKLLSLYQSGKKEEVKIFANDLAASEIINPAFKELVKIAAKGKRFSKKQKSLGFEFFSGDISGHHLGAEDWKGIQR